jgi:4-hydroxyproline epimerase
MLKIKVIDSHTAGEPTRVVIAGGPELGTGSLAERRDLFRARLDRYRCAIVNEPRGSDVLVGALLVPPTDPGCAAGVIFFNNVGYLGMCGHGTIGVITTLAHLGRIGAGEHRIETPVGIVAATLDKTGGVSVANVPSRREHHAITLDVRGHGPVTGDIAWGGNWFFLCDDHGQLLRRDNVAALTDFCQRIREALDASGYSEVDHVELSSPSPTSGFDSRNFVLCPGGAYDRSPCGTGTSAKLACLAAEGRLAENKPWLQESIIGSLFIGRYRWVDHTRTAIAPVIAGTAFVNAEATLLIDERDPFHWGIA